MRSSRKNIILLVIVAAMIAGGVLYWLANRGKEHTDDAALESAIIPIAAKVSGYVIELNVGDNQSVKKGDVILKIDPRDYQTALDEAKANLVAAQSRLDAGRYNHASTSVSAPSNLESARSQVTLAKAEWDNARKTLKRLQGLDKEARSQQSVDDALAAEKSTHSRYLDAQARLKTAETAPDTLGASEASVKELEADVLKSQAALAMAQNNLDATVLTASEDGKISRRTVEIGTYVQPGQQLMSLVGNDIWVVANFKENQLQHMKAGQPVDIAIDAYPDHTFTGKIDSVQAGTGARFSLFPPENATGNFVKVVQRVPVKITFDSLPDKEFSLGPGMSVVPTVHVQ